jgi:poly(A) polymerase
LGFPIEPATADAIRAHAAQIRRISPERVYEELTKMFEHPSRAEAIRLAGELSLLDHLWPEAKWAPGQIDRAVRTLAALPAGSDFVEGLTVLLAEFEPGEVRRVGKCLHASNQQIDEAAWLREHLADLDEAEAMSLPAFKRLIGNPRFDSLLRLHRAVCEASGRSTEANDAAHRRRDDIPPDEVAPPPLVTGDDLIAMGLKPGPRFKAILTQLYDEQLDNRLADRDAALARLKAMLS